MCGGNNGKVIFPVWSDGKLKNGKCPDGRVQLQRTGKKGTADQAGSRYQRRGKDRQFQDGVKRELYLDGRGHGDAGGGDFKI